MYEVCPFSKSNSFVLFRRSLTLVFLISVSSLEKSELEGWGIYSFCVILLQLNSFPQDIYCNAIAPWYNDTQGSEERF